MLGNKKVVLIVEDALTLQELYKTILEKNGAIVLQATTNEEALVCFLENKTVIDSIIIDGNLPDGTTEELIRRMRKDGFEGKMIANSGDINEKLMSAGCDIDSPKPTRIDQILEALT